MTPCLGAAPASGSTSSMQAEWAYQRPYSSNHERLDALPRFLAYYNHRRPHGGIGGAIPASRL